MNRSVLNSTKKSRAHTHTNKNILAQAHTKNKQITPYTHWTLTRLIRELERKNEREEEASEGVKIEGWETLQEKLEPVEHTEKHYSSPSMSS